MATKTPPATTVTTGCFQPSVGYLDAIAPRSVFVRGGGNGGVGKPISARFSRMGAHFTTLRDRGHIKFWSVCTLSTQREEEGFGDHQIRFVVGAPALAKSMVVRACRPA